MNVKRTVRPFVVVMILIVQGCTATRGDLVENVVNSNTITIYDNKIIPPNCGISTGTYTKVDGYRYVNIAVEFEQKEAKEESVSLGVVFAHSSKGKRGARRYFTFDHNFTSPADPQMITVSGKNSWHGHPHDKSSYIARLPIMGPFIQVFPFNHHDEERRLSVSLYLTN